MTNELRRWRHRIDHGDVIQSPRGEYVLWADYDELAQAHMTLIGEFQAQEAELEALKHDNERLMKSLNAEVNAHEPSADATPLERAFSEEPQRSIVDEAIRKLNATDPQVWNDLRTDLMVFGVSCSRRKPDGTIERVEPKDIMFKAPEK